MKATKSKISYVKEHGVVLYNNSHLTGPTKWRWAKNKWYNIETGDVYINMPQEINEIMKLNGATESSKWIKSVLYKN